MQVLCGQREALRPQYLVYEEHIHRRLGSRKNPVPCVARCPAVELLRQIGDRDLPDFHGKQVQVIGGGNVAMDAALRSADYLVTGENPDPDAFTAARGKKHRKEAIFSVPGAGEVRVAVASGLGNTRKLMKSLCKRGVLDLTAKMTLTAVKPAKTHWHPTEFLFQKVLYLQCMKGLRDIFRQRIKPDLYQFKSLLLRHTPQVSLPAACFLHLQDQQQAQGHQQLFIRALPEEEEEDGQQQQVPGIHAA